MFKKYFLHIYLSGLVFSLNAQIDPGEAEALFKKGNYLGAINEYKKLLKVERDDAEYNYKLALCYLKTNCDRTQAVLPLERALKQKKYPSDAPYYLALAYTYNYEFDKSLEILNEYRKKCSGKELQRVDKLTENCNTAKQMMLTPINVKFENLGSGINSEFPDYYPFTTANETTIYFTSRRKDGKSKVLEYDGYYASEIYTTSFDGEKFSPAKNMTNFNSTFDDQVVGLSADGENVFVFTTAGTAKYGELVKYSKKQGTFKKETFIQQVNQEKSVETSGYMSPDGDIIFFASNRSGGYGGFDIWMIRKLPNGLWGLPFNAGPEINTPADEDFPTLSVDGTKLYFSSNGHPGMGGYDLFESEWNYEAGTFSTPKNMGYPLNTPYDELTISFSEDGKHAYLSAWKKEGLGDLDIYRVTFEEIEFIQTLYIITIPSGIETDPYIKHAVITVNNEKGETVGIYRANQNNGRYIMILGPGKYTMEVEAEGYKPHSEKIKVNEFTHRIGKIEKVVYLEK